MSLRVVLTELVIQPAGLVYLALGCVLVGLLRHRHARVALLAGAVCLVALLALGAPGIGAALLVSLEQDTPLIAPADAPPRAIVILSAGVDRTPEGLEPGPLTLQRLLQGARLWRRARLPVLVSGGVLGPGDIPVAVVMAETLKRDFHVPVRWIEDRSGTTWENAADSAAILAPAGIRSVYLVTHAWHERRAVLAFRHFGLIPIAAPVPADLVSGGFLPSIRGWSRSYYALHEWAGLLVYSLRAWYAGPVAGAAVSSSVPSNNAP